MTEELVAAFRHYQPGELSMNEGYQQALLSSAEGVAGVCPLEPRWLRESPFVGYRALLRAADLVRWDADVELGLWQVGSPLETVTWPARVWYPFQAGTWHETQVRIPEGTTGDLCFLPIPSRDALLAIPTLAVLINPLENVAILDRPSASARA